MSESERTAQEPRTREADAAEREMALEESGAPLKQHGDALEQGRGNRHGARQAERGPDKEP